MTLKNIKSFILWLDLHHLYPKFSQDKKRLYILNPVPEKHLKCVLDFCDRNNINYCIERKYGALSSWTTETYWFEIKKEK